MCAVAIGAVIFSIGGIIFLSWNWLGQNSKPLTVVLVVIQSMILAGGLFYAKVTLDEGNRIAWRTYLDTRAAALGRKLLDQEPMRCVYHYGIQSVDNDCRAKVLDIKNVTQNIIYLQTEISHLREVKEYDHDLDSGYYENWYKDDAMDLATDLTGIVSFVLYDIYKCNIDQNCADKIQAELLICVYNEKFEPDEAHCRENLLNRRKQFLESMGEWRDIDAKH